MFVRGLLFVLFAALLGMGQVGALVHGLYHHVALADGGHVHAGHDHVHDVDAGSEHAGLGTQPCGAFDGLTGGHVGNLPVGTASDAKNEVPAPRFYALRPAVLLQFSSRAPPLAPA
jgi:hypothetical protein